MKEVIVISDTFYETDAHNNKYYGANIIGIVNTSNIKSDEIVQEIVDEAVAKASVEKIKSIQKYNDEINIFYENGNEYNIYIETKEVF